MPWNVYGEVDDMHFVLLVEYGAEKSIHETKITERKVK